MLLPQDEGTSSADGAVATTADTTPAHADLSPEAAAIPHYLSSLSSVEGEVIELLEDETARQRHRHQGLADDGDWYNDDGTCNLGMLLQGSGFNSLTRCRGRRRG
jgi:hypothetical protein